MIGKELALAPGLSTLERVYVRLLGAPIHGFRVRYRRLMPLLREMVAQHGLSANILDAGCGSGLFTMALAKEFPDCQVLGMDNCADLIESNSMVANRAGIRNCSFELGDVLNLHRVDAFDLIVCIDNLEHIEDDERALASLHTALSPGGMMLLHVPGLYRRWPVFAKRINFDVKGHVRPGYLMESIRDKTARAGFVMEDARYTYGWLETISNNISYCITGAAKKNRYAYALAFPLLNVVAWLGRKSKPAWGAGVVLSARKPKG